MYISNLPLSMDEQELENMLKHFGQVISTRILRDSSGHSRGVGFARSDPCLSLLRSLTTLHVRQILTRSFVSERAWKLVTGYTVAVLLLWRARRSTRASENKYLLNYSDSARWRLPFVWLKYLTGRSWLIEKQKQKNSHTFLYLLSLCVQHSNAEAMTRVYIGRVSS